jgi:hypothetical protein
MGVDVTCFAVGDRLDILDDFMLDFQMAEVAIDFALSDVLIVHQIGVIVLLEAFLFHMTPVAVLPWHIPVAHNGVAVAFVARIAVIEDEGMIVPRRFFGGELFPVVAVGAVVDLRIVVTFLEMTDEAAAFGHRDVFSLNDLGVAARALEFFSPPEVFEVNFMVEDNGFEHNLAFQQPFVVAACLQTAVVTYLSPGL